MPAFEVLGVLEQVFCVLGFGCYGLPCDLFSWEPHPMKCLCVVMFTVWVHAYAMRMWHPFCQESLRCPLGIARFSDLAFSYILVRPSLILRCAWYAIVSLLMDFLLSWRSIHLFYVWLSGAEAYDVFYASAAWGGGGDCRVFALLLSQSVRLHLLLQAL